MTLFRLLNASSQASEMAEEAASTPWFFWVVVGALGVGFIVMIVQNFILKKEEYYK